MRRDYVDAAIASGVAILDYTAVSTHLPAALTIVLGTSLFVAPGYVWSKVLLKTAVPAFERVGIAVGISLMVPVFGGLALYALGIPLHQKSWIALLGSVTLFGSLAIMLQSRPSSRSFSTSNVSRKRLPMRHVAAFSVAVVIAVLAVALAVFGADAQKNPGFTELWLSPITNDPSMANLGVTNEQGGTVRYRLELFRMGKISVTWNLTLANGQEWRRVIPFTNQYSVTAKLYKIPDLTHAYRLVSNDQ